MKPIIREAFNITKDLGSVTFVGAVAVILQTNELRQSQDIDFVIANEISNEELLNKQYRIVQENKKEKKYTPRGYKIDIYSSRDLNDIPLQTIIDKAQAIPIDNKGNTVNTMSLETLIVSKFRANRDQDVEDLNRIVKTRYKDISVDNLRELTKNDTELKNIQNTLRFFAENP
ncbi:nucleotidyltransferase [Nitrosopumilus sp.]|uniref:nucleotidyltransferase n=1 Tax=Nitrosopumilus sp. TaxID=2024843 RepID=UPI0034A0A5B5